MFLTQEGMLGVLTDIKTTTLRLQFSPIFQLIPIIHNQSDIKNWNSQVNGGMDVKYGINQGILHWIWPWFPISGQVQVIAVLNLTPFEVKVPMKNRTFLLKAGAFNKTIFLQQAYRQVPIHRTRMADGQWTTEEYVWKTRSKTSADECR